MTLLDGYDPGLAECHLCINSTPGQRLHNYSPSIAVFVLAMLR